MEVRGDVLKSLETARNEKLIGAPLEARVRLSANGDLYPLLRAVCRRAAGAVHRFAGGRWNRGAQARPGRQGGARRRREVRALLEVHHGCRLAMPTFPTDLRARAPSAVDEMLNG